MATTNKTLDDGLDVFLMIAGRGYKPTDVRYLCEAASRPEPTVRRIIRTLEAKNLISRTDGGYILSKYWITVVAAYAADLSGRIAELREVRDTVDVAKHTLFPTSLSFTVPANDQA